MIIDTSALVAILRDEPEAKDCALAIERNRNRRVSAANFFEAALVIDGVVAGLGYNQRFAKGQPGAARRNGVPGKRRPLEGS